jgi:hypothetical protein
MYKMDVGNPDASGQRHRERSPERHAQGRFQQARASRLRTNGAKNRKEEQ